MNAYSIFVGEGEAIGDADALVLMLDYIVAEAERLGLHGCAGHAELARQALAPQRKTSHRYRL